MDAVYAFGEDRQLSRRERQVLGLLCRSQTNTVLAAFEANAEGAIRIYCKRAEHRLRAGDLLQTAPVSQKLGLLDLDAMAENLAAECCVGKLSVAGGGGPFGG